MSALRKITVEVSEDLARRIDAEVSSGFYSDEADLVVDSLEAHFDAPLLRHGDPEVERWLRDEVVPTLERIERENTPGIPSDQVLARLKARHEAKRQRA